MIRPRILVVDDDDRLCEILRKIFESAGYDVDTAPDGVLGLQSLRDRKPDVVILDILMPRCDGIEMLREIRRSKMDMKIVAVSGGGGTTKIDYLHLAHLLGADRSMRKPLSLDAVLTVVEELIGDATDTATGNRSPTSTS